MATQTATSPTYVQRLKKGLITKEDPYHVHKTLGILCLISFAFRYSHLPSMAFDTHPALTLPTLLLHFMLSASSFEFRLPAKRVKDGRYVVSST